MISTNSPITASYPLPPKRQGPDFPFKLISAFASSHQWKNFTTSLCLKETQLVIDSQRAQTSCIETLRNLCHIFLTTNEAR